MRTRNGTDKLGTGRQSETSRVDGLHSIDGRRPGNGCDASTKSTCSGSGGRTNEGDDRGIETKTWFNPVEEDSCPGGVCPVPWATDTSGDDEPAAAVETEVKNESNNIEREEDCNPTQSVADRLWEFYLEQHRKIEQERLYSETMPLGLNQQEYKGYLKGTIIDTLRKEPNTSALKKARYHLDTLIKMMEA
tara:strand:- start:6083 stop:6655 length:573 start_codon:yes stop_codon:yes gene_type:complete